MPHSSVNLNSSVWVRLTKEGTEELERIQDELQSLTEGHFKPSEIVVDEFGYTKFRLWVLMSTLGHMCRMAANTPFELDIMLVKPTADNVRTAQGVEKKE